VLSVEMQPTFRRNISPPSSGSKKKIFSKNQQVARCFPPAYFLVLDEFSSTLKMDAICSSETLVASQQTTRRYVPEDDSFHNHRCENLKSYLLEVVWELTKIWSWVPTGPEAKNDCAGVDQQQITALFCNILRTPLRVPIIQS
jgi:hypothetical protein